MHSLASPFCSSKILALFPFLILFLVCIKDGAILSPDSSTYINHSIFRMGLYPLLISLFQHVFKDYAFQALASFQIIFTLLISYVLAQLLKRTFRLPLLISSLSLAVFLSPLMVYSVGNEILSEGITYPLFLLTAYFLLKGLFTNNARDLYFFSFSCFFLVFTRQQYAFFYGVGIVVFLYFVFFQKAFPKKGMFFLSIIVSLSSFFISERLYHYVYHGHFSGTPFTGIELVIRPLFVSTEDSYKSFEDPKQRLFVEKAVQTILDKKLMDPDPHKRELNSFALNCNAIRYGIVSPLLEIIWSKQSLKEFDYHQTTNAQLVSISLNLIQQNFKPYMKSYIKDVIRGVGGYILFGFVLFVCILCFWNLLYSPINELFYFAFILSSLIHFWNLTLVCLFEYSSLLRYTYSTGCLLFCMLLILGYQFSKRDLCVE